MKPIVEAQQNVDFCPRAIFVLVALFFFQTFVPESRHGKSNWHNWLGNCVGRPEEKGLVPRMSREGGSAIGSKVMKDQVGFFHRSV